jgi:uncharacterized protein (TIGR00288 family)
LSPWWLRASDDELDVDAAAEAEAFAGEDLTLDGDLEAEPAPTIVSPENPGAFPAPPVVESTGAGAVTSADPQPPAGPSDDESTPEGRGRKRRRRRRRRGGGSPAAASATGVLNPDADPDADFDDDDDELEGGEEAALEKLPQPKLPEVKPAELKPSSSEARPPRAPKPAGAEIKPAEQRSHTRIRHHAPRPSPQEKPRYVETEVEAPQPLEHFGKTVVYALPERAPADERKLAMFVDFENIALGVRDSEVRILDINLILERLLEKGKIIVKKAYADWERYSDYKRPFHEAAIELIDIPQKFYSGKNSADIKMVVDAMDLCYSKDHLDTFVLVSGDSDFSPLVSKLKENNKYVIGLGVKNSTSSLLVDNCDEFIYYEDVWRDAQRVPRLDHLSPKEAECFQLMCESIVALLRENKDVLWGSLLKQTIQRKRPSFSEGYYGYATFSELLEDAERKNIIRLRREQRSGNIIVAGFAGRAKR